MIMYIVRRMVLMVPTVAVISLISFVIIELPPGDYVTTQLVRLMEGGGDRALNERLAESLREQYGLDKPWPVRYLRWVWRFMHGDMGYSMIYNQPVKQLIGARLGLTIVISVASLLFIWIIAFPIGIYSAVKQYSVGDYVFTFFGFLGLAIPNFLLALILMYLLFKYFGISAGGLFSPELAFAPWSIRRVLDLLGHLVVPIIVVGTAGTARTIRIMRANLLDELKKAYVVTARAKGLSELRVIFKYPVRIALNPFVSTVGWILPSLISGSVITSVVLALPTSGPLFLEALMLEDMYLAGAFVMLFSILTVIGTLISDILLAILDPRIRYGS